MSSNPAMQTIAGIATARGFAAGPVFIYHGDGELPVPEYVVEPGREGDELLRFKRAYLATKRDLEGIVATLKSRSTDDDARLFECHLMILEDPMMTGEIEKSIIEDHVNAEAAVRKSADRARARFGRMNDPYFRERVRDIDDIERRILKTLVGNVSNLAADLKVPSVIVANDLTPSETVQLPRELVLGFATDGGSATSHVALLARAMGIPAVTGLGNITSLVRPGETVLLDGTNGAVTIAPDRAAQLDFEDLVERQREISEEAVIGHPAGTLKDGGEVLIYANVHPGVPVGGLKEHGARGVGLYRSEYLWLNREREPSEEIQFAAYRDAARFASTISDKSSITIRLLDIGGDKIVRGISKKESNPFLGNRSIRYLLSNPDIFRTQVRAVLRASHYGHVAMLYPMISCVEELDACAKLLSAVKAELDAEHIPYDAKMPVGAMIEVPAAALNAEVIARHVDFLSIGTNDLVQYTMAADRGNESVASLYQPTNPAILRLMRMSVAAARKAGIPVGVCGESAADPIVGVLWAAMGIDILSMSATYIPIMSKLFSRLTRADLDDYLKMVDGLGDDVTASQVLEACRAWMRQKIPDLDSFLI